MKPKAWASAPSNLDGASRTPVPQASVTVDRLSLPLDTLSPFIAVFVPRTRVAGEIRGEGLRVAGPIQGVFDRQPETLAGRMAFEDVKVVFPPADLRIRNIDGALDLGRPGVPPGYGLDGQIALTGIRAGEQRIGRGTLAVRGRVGRLGPPRLGPTEVGLAVDLNAIDFPGISGGIRRTASGFNGA